MDKKEENTILSTLSKGVVYTLKSKLLIPLYAFIGVLQLIMYLLFDLELGKLEYAFFTTLFLSIFVLSTSAMAKTKKHAISIFAFTLVWVIAAYTYVFIDGSGEYVRFGLDKELSYWFFSAMLQGFAALLGIIGAFLAMRLPIKKDQSNAKDKILGLNEFYPAIFLIVGVIITSVICLPFSPVLEFYPSILFTLITITILLGILSVLFIFVSIFKIYISSTKATKNSQVSER